MRPQLRGCLRYWYPALLPGGDRIFSRQGQVGTAQQYVREVYVGRERKDESQDGSPQQDQCGGLVVATVVHPCGVDGGLTHTFPQRRHRSKSRTSFPRARANMSTDMFRPRHVCGDVAHPQGQHRQRHAGRGRACSGNLSRNSPCWSVAVPTGLFLFVLAWRRVKIVLGKRDRADIVEKKTKVV